MGTRETAQGQKQTNQKSTSRCSCPEESSGQMNGQFWVERCLRTPLERIQVISRKKYSQRKAVPKFTQKRDRGMEMLIDSYKGLELNRGGHE